MQNVNLSYHVKNHIGWITLNRPSALNALSFEMIEALYMVLQQWENDDQVVFVCLEGEGDRAFCSGGDVKALYDLRESTVLDYAFKFFTTEYMMNMTLFCYPKPILVYMNGVVMGGGVGISIGASHRIVTEKTMWGMPEMNIGLYPDVGGSYFLNQMPGHIGRYLALTSKTIHTNDVIHIGAADYCIDSRDWNQLKVSLEIKNWSSEIVHDELVDILFKHHQRAHNNSISSTEDKINNHFKFETMEEIIDSLEGASQSGDIWAFETVKLLLTKSPTSLKVTLKQLIEGKKKDLFECFKMELNLSMNFMKGHDFFEGVRAVLVHKDRAPKWVPASLEAIKEHEVEAYFHYDWKGPHPLEAFIEKYK